MAFPQVVALLITKLPEVWGSDRKRIVSSSHAAWSARYRYLCALRT